MSFLSDMVKVTGNEYAAVVEDGLEGADISGYIDTGTYILNALLSGSIYGGLPANKITGIAGMSSSGKTLIALGLVKTFLDANKKAVCLYFDSENAVTSDMFRTRGIDPKRVAVIGVSTIEEFRNQAIKIVDSYLAMTESEKVPMFMVLDSLGMLSSTKEMADTSDGKDTKDMTKAQVAKATFRVLTLKLGKAGIPLVVTAHTYDTQSMYSTKVVAGGEGLRYAASTIIMLSKRKEKVDDEIVGNVMHATLSKSRFTKENSSVDMLLRYDTGLHKYYGLLDLAESQGVIKKISNKYEFPDGTKAFESAVYKNPEKFFTKEILDLIDTAAGKQFKYGSDQAQ